jgi:hypothetical protein
MHALVAEAMKKAAIVWIAPEDAGSGYPMWCLAVDGALHVVTGGDEQPAPGLAGAATATVTARGDHGGQIVSWPVRVERIMPDSPEWPALTTTLAGKRLNASGSAEALAAVWAETCTVLRLTPIGDEVGARPEGSGAAAPKPTPAASRTAKPFRLHRVKRRS